MTSLAPAASDHSGPPAKTSDVWGDRLFRGLALAAGMLVLVILALIAWATISKAWAAFSHEGPSFVTGQHWEPNTGHFGALAFIYGTLVSSTIALVFAVPLSLGIALFITELASKRLSRLVTYFIDLLAAIPSVVYGLWAIFVLTKPIKGVYQHIADTLGKLPLLSRLFGGPVSGAAFMTAGLILAVMITPIITSLSREALLTVPQDDKNAALAMGATRWEMLRVAVFPRVKSGLIGAMMLGLGRALGETIAVAFVIGSSHQVTSHVFRSGDSMAAVIAHNFGESTGLQRSALIGLGAVLFAITIVVNVIARYISSRSAIKQAVAR
ncbi:MAG TPA: phosphate ABC transporter permease subunit PstC [Acidimicrobiia bacterium]|jgi:phosphate transport system permease protein|nr:phosphate ABC transporter permease subunit PstC [Acidimicrobiia bacterium]